MELAKEWRSDKHLRRMLNAVLVVADKDVSLTLSGNGDVLEHQDGVCGIGSGGIYAQCAALALKDIPVRHPALILSLLLHAREHVLPKEDGLPGRRLCVCEAA